MKISLCEQGADIWLDIKRGTVSASHFSEVLSKSTGRKTYMMKLVAERLTGLTQNGYSNTIMERGIEVEPQARVYYEELNECKVVQVGFIIRDDNETGCSPDGLVGDDGLVEIKCPNTTTHIDTILKGKMQASYVPQVQGQMWVAERKWCDYISFDPRLEQHPFFCTRIFRDDSYIMVLEAAVNQFVKEMKEIIAKVKGK